MCVSRSKLKNGGSLCNGNKSPGISLQSVCASGALAPRDCSDVRQRPILFLSAPDLFLFCRLLTYFCTIFQAFQGFETRQTLPICKIALRPSASIAPTRSLILKCQLRASRKRILPVRYSKPHAWITRPFLVAITAFGMGWQLRHQSFVQAS